MLGMPGLATPLAVDAKEFSLSSLEAKSVLIAHYPPAPLHTQPFVSSMPKLAQRALGHALANARRCGMPRTEGMGMPPCLPPTVGGGQWTENTEQLLTTDTDILAEAFHGLLVLCSKLVGDK